MKASKKWVPFFFVGPHIIIFLIFFAIPFVSSLFLSFTEWNMLSPAKFVGFENYRNLLLNKDSIYFTHFWSAFRNTFIFSLISVPLLVAVPLMIAVFLNYQKAGRHILQSIFFIPSLFSVATVVLMWQWLMDSQKGLINNFFHLNISWTTQQPYFWIAIIIMTIWWTIGTNMIIFLAGISEISEDLYEASAIDGAGEFKKFFYITLPGLKNQMFYIFITTSVASLNLFGQPFMFASGKPGVRTGTFVTYIRDYAFGSGQSRAGIASSMSVLIGLMAMSVVIFQFYGMRKEEKMRVKRGEI